LDSGRPRLSVPVSRQLLRRVVRGAFLLHWRQCRWLTNGDCVCLQRTSPRLPGAPYSTGKSGRIPGQCTLRAVLILLIYAKTFYESCPSTCPTYDERGYLEQPVNVEGPLEQHRRAKGKHMGDFRSNGERVPAAIMTMAEETRAGRMDR